MTMPLRTIKAWVWVPLLLVAGCGKAPESKSAPVAAKPAGNFDVASVFPAGAGRDQVMNGCGNCHPVLCVTRGQRTAERWEGIKGSHKDKMTDASPADLNVMFAYLTENFNDKKPEPQVPPELLSQGCTPF